LLLQLAYLPVHVIITSLVIEKMINRREKRVMMAKLNMVIGAFFSDVGVELLISMSSYHENYDKLRSELLITDNWNKKDFATGRHKILGENFEISCTNNNLHNLKNLKEFLMEKRSFQLSLLQNPNLLEHESFTDMLWAVFHLTDELIQRKDTSALSKSDYKHLSIDIERAYTLLITEWLSYMEHLQKNYPYLYSLAVRVNPFNPDASANI
ncbi:MAG: hypothetical protein WCR27_06490, partial [Eubacteriales bacterium]